LCIAVAFTNSAIFEANDLLRCRAGATIHHEVFLIMAIWIPSG
jgi:hypothetical protein